MTPVREALVLPGMLLTVTLLGGLHIADRVALVPPSLFALVLALLTIGLLVRSGALAPERLVDGRRSALENLSGAIVLTSLFLATAQVFTLTTPASGLPRVLVNLFFVALLANTVAAAPDRAHVLRSLAVIAGAGFILKFIVLAGLSAPAESSLGRVARLLFEGATLGAITQETLHPATGYIAFATLLLYLFALILLPGRASSAPPAITSRGRHGIVITSTDS